MTRSILRAGALCAFALVLAAPLVAQAAPTLGPRQLTLQEAMRLAVPASEELKISQAQVMYANGEVKRSYSEFLPQFTITGTYLHLLKSQYDVKIDSSVTTSCPAFTPVPSNPTDQRLDSLESQVSCLSTLDPFASLGFLPFARPNQYNIGVTLGWTIFNGSIVNGRTRAAKAGRKLADLGITTTQAQLLLDVTQAYFDAALADQLVIIAQDALDQADTTLKQAELGLKVGSQAEFEVLRARVSRDNTRVVVIQRRSDRDIAAAAGPATGAHYAAGRRLGGLAELPRAAAGLGPGHRYGTASAGPPDRRDRDHPGNSLQDCRRRMVADPHAHQPLRPARVPDGCLSRYQRLPDRLERGAHAQFPDLD